MSESNCAWLRISGMSVFMVRYLVEVVLNWLVFAGFLWHAKYSFAGITVLVILFPIISSIAIDLLRRRDSSITNGSICTSNVIFWIGSRSNKLINPFMIIRSGIRYIRHIYHNPQSQEEALVCDLTNSQDFMARYLSFPQVLVQGTILFWECGSTNLGTGSLAWYRIAQIVISFWSMASSVKAQLMRTQPEPFERVQIVICYLEAYTSTAYLLLMLSISGGIIFHGPGFLNFTWLLFVAIMWWIHSIWSRSIFYSLAIQAGSWGAFYWGILYSEALNDTIINIWLFGFLFTFSLAKVLLVLHHAFIGKPMVFPSFADSERRSSTFPRNWNHPLASSGTLVSSGHFYQRLNEHSYATSCYRCGKSFSGWNQFTITDLETKFLHRVYCKYFKSMGSIQRDELEMNKPLLERKPPNAVDIFVFTVRMAVYLTFLSSCSQFVIHRLLAFEAFALLIIGLFFDCLILVINTNRRPNSAFGIARFSCSAVRLMINFKKHPVHGIKSTIFTNFYMLLIHALTFGNLFMPTKCDEFCPSTFIVTCMMSPYVLILQGWPFYGLCYKKLLQLFACDVHPVNLSPSANTPDQV